MAQDAAQELRRQLLCNEKIVLAKLLPVGSRTLRGVSNKYDDEYPLSLKGIVEENEFRFAMRAINSVTDDYFPCDTCRVCNFFTHLLTLGAILACPDPCTMELEMYLRQTLERINAKPIYADKGVQWEFVKRPCSSWIEILQVPAI